MLNRILTGLLCLQIVVNISCKKETIVDPDIEYLCEFQTVDFGMNEAEGTLLTGKWKVDYINFTSCNETMYEIGSSQPSDYFITFGDDGTILGEGSYAMAIYGFDHNDEVVSVGDCFYCQLWNDFTWAVSGSSITLSKGTFTQEFNVNQLDLNKMILLYYTEWDDEMGAYGYKYDSISFSR